MNTWNLIEFHLYLLLYIFGEKKKKQKTAWVDPAQYAFIRVHLRKIISFVCMKFYNYTPILCCTHWFFIRLKINKLLGFVWVLSICLKAWKIEHYLNGDFVNNKTTVSFKTLVALLTVSLWQLQELSMTNILMLNKVL